MTRIIRNNSYRKRSKKPIVNGATDLVYTPSAIKGILDHKHRIRKSEPIENLSIDHPFFIRRSLTAGMVKKAIPHIRTEKLSYGLMNITGFGVSHSSLHRADRFNSKIRSAHPKEILRGIVSI